MTATNNDGYGYGMGLGYRTLIYDLRIGLQVTRENSVRGWNISTTSGKELWSERAVDHIDAKDSHILIKDIDFPCRPATFVSSLSCQRALFPVPK